MSFLFSSMETLASFIDAFSNSISRKWTSFREGPLREFIIFLLLFFTGLVIIIEALCEEWDKFLAFLEKSFISIAMLIMVALSFMDYLRREIEFINFEIDGGANASVVLMVWVGFLGASLATRQKKHLAVDATDRILSPKAARVAKRFTALVAATFCWQFGGHAMSMVESNLLAGLGQDALPLWGIAEAPVNTLGNFLFNANHNVLMPVMVACLVGWVGLIRSNLIPKSIQSPVGALLLFVGGLSWVGSQWNPNHDSGEAYTFEAFGEEEETTADTTSKGAPSIADLIAEDTGDVEEKPSIADLIAEDTGDEAGTDDSNSAEMDADLAAFLADSKSSEKFPLWLAQSVIPLSFFLMAFRFFALGLSGRFTSDEEDDGNAENISVAEIEVDKDVVVKSSTVGKGARDLLFAGLFPGILIGLFAAWGGTASLGWVVLIGAVLLVLVGSPLFLAIGLASLACVTLIQDISAYNISKDMYEAVKKEELLAIPFFVLAGNLMTEGTIAQRLVGVARAVMGRTPGGLGLASIAACVIFAAISGSSPVTVIAVGSIMFPMLVKERYPENYSLGVLTSAGSLGIIIPPSVPMIIYAIMVSQTLTAVGKEYIIPETGLLPGGLDPTQVLQVSPTKLFIAGVLPGLFIAGVLALYTLYQTRPTRKDIDIVVPEFEGTYWGNLIKEVKNSFLSIMLPVLILGGIYGILGPLKFTVTEAAAVAVVYALIVELVFHRELKPSKLPEVLSKSGVMMGSLFLIIVLAIAFNKFLAEQYIPQNAAAWIQAHVNAKWQFLILVNIFLLGLGCVMDIISAILIVAPLLAPIALSYGIHPLHFGIMFIVNLELGYLTPPLGINLFVSSTVFKRPVIDVMKGSLPFLLLMIFCLAVIVMVPFLSLALI